MKNVLVMGGTSFVSSSLAKYLIKRGYNVDILTRGVSKVNYKGFKDHLICNRKSKEKMKEVLKDKEYEFIFDISAYTEEDVKILLESVNINSLNKYIFCSSGAVYKSSGSIVDESFEKGENPNWGKYGTDKKEAEDFIISSGVPYMIFRPTYVYGEDNNLYREGYFFDRIIEKKVIPVPSGDAKTQFIHIDDLVKVFESAMISEKSCSIYNVTHTEVITWEMLIRTCGTVIRKSPIMKKVKTEIESRAYFPFRDVTYMLSIEKLKKDGLFIPNISLENGLRKTYEWYRSANPILSDRRMNRIEELI